MLSIASLPPNADTRHGDYRIKIIHLSYYQSFEYFLFFSIFAIFCYSVHFEISFSFAKYANYLSFSYFKKRPKGSQRVHRKRVKSFTLFFYALFNSATNGCGISSHPDKSGHRRTNSDSPCRPSKYSIFSRYLWAGLFP